MKAHDTSYVVVTTGRRPYMLPFTSAATAAGARAAYRAVVGFNPGAHLRVVRVKATWEVKP